MIKNKRLLILLLVFFIGALLTIFNKYSKPVDKWERIKSELVKCTVKSVSQAHNLTVSVVLKDGTYISASEPKIDEISQLVKAANKLCKETIIHSTE